MKAALAAGAKIVNDVCALTGDAAALETVARSGAYVILMHKLGDPETMQDAPAYDDVVADILAYLELRIGSCEAAGISHGRIAVDPGIGFGKTMDHNLELIARLDEFGKLDVPVAIGVSRKSFISAVAGKAAPKDRLGGSLAAILAAFDRGAQILRVHDVAATAQAVALRQALRTK